MKTKTYLKGAGVLLLTAVLLFSATAVTANTGLTASHNLNTQPKAQQTNRDVIWDNGAYTTNALSSQLDTAYPFNSQVADDFKFTSQQTVGEVIFWGFFWNGAAINPIDLNVLFYNDDGTGNQPTGAGTADPTSTALQVEHHAAVMGTDNGDGTFTYDIVLNTPFVANANTKYWFVSQWAGNFPPQWGCCVSVSQQLHVCDQGFPLLNVPYWTPETTYGDVAFQLIGAAPPAVPKLDASGTLAWSKIKAGATVNGTFTVTNVGDNNSMLNWKVSTWPTWGNWTFTPSSGTGLAKGATTTVTVNVVVPAQKKASFNGTVRVVNTDNTSNYVDIPVTLTTPLNQGMHGQSFFERLFELFPHAFPILRHLLGY
jgi:hypothetical protein